MRADSVNFEDGTPSIVPGDGQPRAAPLRYCAICGDARVEGAPCAACARRVAVSLSSQSDEVDQFDRRARPLRPALALYFSLLGTSVIYIIALVAGADNFAARCLVTVIMSGLIVAFCAPQWRDLLAALRQVPRQWCAAAPVLAVLTFASAMAVSTTMNAISGAEPVNPVADDLTNGASWWLIVTLWCVQPALFEELAFRGQIFNVMRRSLGARETIIVTAVMFMTIHLTVPMFPFLFFIGLVLGWLRWRSGSLVPGIILHFTHNLLAISF